MVQEKKSRMQRRADKEIGVVKNCKDEYDSKVASLKGQRDEIRANIELAKEKVRNTTNAETKRDIAREINNMNAKLKNLLISLDSFERTSENLHKLMDLLQNFYDQGLFSFIVHKIPEKKLPKLVKNPEKVDRVYDLVINLLKEFNDKMNRIAIASEGTRKAWKEEEAKVDYVREQIGNDTDDLNALIESIESEGAEAENYDAKQAPAQNNKINRA